MADTRIPILLLTGFLGAGKTTLLNTLLWQKEFADAAVFINEFGAVGVDHALVQKLDDDVVLLDSGCICCTMRGDLPKALKTLFNRAQRREIPVPAKVVLETSGISDPAPVIEALLSDAFISERFRLDGVITVVSATHGLGQIDTNPEAVKQVVMADRLLISKCDLMSEAELDVVAEKLVALNPSAQQVRVSKGAIHADAVLNCGMYDPATKMPDVAAWLAAERIRLQPAPAVNAYSRTRKTQASTHTAQEIQSFVLEFDAPLHWGEVSTTLETLLQSHGEQLLRIKGLLNIEGEPGPRIVQCVQHVRYPSIRLSEWPRQAPYSDQKGRLVFITRNLPEQTVRASLGCIDSLI